MASKEQQETKTTRRDFLRSATLVGAGAALTGCAPISAEAPQQAPAVSMPEKWDVETDVVVVGYGGAGAVTAITAHDQGAKVLILEKQAEDGHTSNTQMCAGVFVSPDTVEDAIAYMEVASRVNVDMPESKDIDDDVIQIWAEYMAQNRDWMQEMGIQDFSVYAKSGRDPDWPGNDAIKAYQIQNPDGSPGVGVDFFNFLAEKVNDRNIEVMWEAPATSLVLGDDGEVHGIKVRDQDQGEMMIKAAKAVVLTCGGFEFDEAALKTYLPAYPMTFYGNPDNTGDGMRMAQAAGADLWHMTVLGGGFKAKFPDFPTAFLTSFGQEPYIVVDKFGKRFKDETKLGGYSGYWNALVYDTVDYTWPRIPVYWIFDEKRRTAGPLVYTFFGAAGPVGMYEWSEDNSKEIDQGWIVKAETIDELAEKLGVDSAILQEEVTKYNDSAEAGEDAEFGRSAFSLAPLETAPYYAVQLWPGLNNTFGGPRRNASAQIVDAYGEPISRLYSAGELGSIYVQYPQGGANVGECIAFGRIAGENSAALEPWG